MALRKTSADLGEKNIPKALVQLNAPTQLSALYWREQASNPPKTTVEIWMLADNTFLGIQGDFSKGDWAQDDVTTIDVFPTLEKAMSSIKASYDFAPVDNAEVAKEHVDQQAVPEAEEPPVEEEKTASKNFKRLVKKN